MNFRIFLILSCVIYVASAVKSDGKIVKFDAKATNESKILSKRSFGLGHHHRHHIGFSLVPASSLFGHKHLVKPAVHVPTVVHKPIVPVHHHHTPTVVQTPTFVQTPSVVHHHQSPSIVHSPSFVHQHAPTFVQPAPTFIQQTPTFVQPAPLPTFPAIQPPVLVKKPIVPYHIAPGGATVTSYAVNYPRFPFLPRSPHYIPPVAIPASKPIIPVAPAPILPFHGPVAGPTILPFAPAPPPQFIPATLPTKPIIPIAVPFPGIQKPKIPILINDRPVYPGLIPFGQVNPQFLPIPVPETPSTQESGTNHNLQPTQASHVTITPQTTTYFTTTQHNVADTWCPISPTLSPTQPTFTTVQPSKQTSYLPPNPSPSNPNYLNNMILGNPNPNQLQSTPSQLHFQQFQQQQQLIQQQNDQQQWQQLQSFQSESLLLRRALNREKK